ncbi:MAG: hypothetical protein ACOYMN_01705 [Roseimicrobium sp.]
MTTTRRRAALAWPISWPPPDWRGRWSSYTRQIYVGITRAMERVVIYADRLPQG